jgi:hypothetical protein
MVVDTPGGRIRVQWDHAASATPNAQLTFFAEFLAATGVYDTGIGAKPAYGAFTVSANLA